MKAVSIVISCTGYTPDEKYFSVCNYDSLNLVKTYGFETKEDAMGGYPEFLVGTWQPKGTKASNEYLPTRIYLSPINE